MRKVFVIVLISFLLIKPSSTQSDIDSIQPRIHSVTQPAMIEWMDSITTFWMDSVDIPGMVVSIVSEDSIVMQKGYGYINNEKSAPVDAKSSPFRIASISKTFTALASLQLVSEGKLDLYADVNNYIDFDIDRYKDSEITLHQLLTHSAGLDERILGGGTKDKTLVPKLGEFLSEYMPGQIRAPGVSFTYSNTGFSLAGYLGEITSGRPFYEYVGELILNPLHMNNTTYWRGDDPIYTESKSYFRDDKGFREYPPYEIRRYPSGSMISTAEDLSNYMMMILNKGGFKGKQVISPEVIEDFTNPVFTQDERLQGSRSYGFFNWDINGVKFLTHGGSIEGYRSMLYLYPEHKVGMFISTNSSWGGWSNSEIGSAFRKKWLETSVVARDTALSQGMPGNASDIEGSYFTTRSPFSSMMRIGRLTNWTLDVKFNDDGYLYIAGDPKTLYAETEPFTYTIASNYNNSAFSPIIFKSDEDGNVKFMFTSGFNSFFKLKWWEKTNIQLIYALSIFVIFLIFLIYNLINLFRKKSSAGGMKYSRIYRSSVLATLFYVITFLTVGFYLYISDGIVFDFGLPWFLKILMLLPLIAIALTIFSLTGMRTALNEWSISRFRRIIFVINLLALIMIIPFMHYWNLLGFNF